MLFPGQIIEGQEHFNLKLYELNKTKTHLIKQLYTKPHREVSMCTEFLISKYKTTNNDNIRNVELLNLKTNLESENDEAKKLNYCRSLVHKNMKYIRNILEVYSKNIEETKKFATFCGSEFSANLLTHSDKITLQKRFENFKKCGPADENLGYNNSIYNEEEFNKLLDSCIQRDSFLKRIKKVFFSQKIE